MRHPYISSISKFLLLTLSLVVVSELMLACSGGHEQNKELSQHLLDGELTFAVYEGGRQKTKSSLILGEKEKSEFADWIKALIEGSDRDNKSYAPKSVFYGSRFNVNFHSDRIIINYTVDESESKYKQCSRMLTREDEKILKLLRKHHNRVK